MLSHARVLSPRRRRYHDGMKRMMIQADEELLARARRRATEQGVSVAQVVRDALERELGSPEGGEPQPPLTCVGIVESGRSDLSELASEPIYEPDRWVS